MRYTFQHNGQLYHITVEPETDGGFRVMVDDRLIEVNASPLPDGGIRLQFGTTYQTVYMAAQGSQRFVQVDGAAYTLSVPRNGRTRHKSTGSDSLTAHMPGQVTRVLVQTGENVTRSQTLLVLEAMKMETRVAAPADGRIVKLLVQVGDVVERGQQLAEFEVHKDEEH